MKIACVNNEKQIGLALTQYISDYDGHIMNRGNLARPEFGGQDCTWDDLLNHYVLRQLTIPWNGYRGYLCPLFHCPSDQSPRYTNPLGYVSYGISQKFADNNQIKIDKISKPSICALAGEYDWTVGTAAILIRGPSTLQGVKFRHPDPQKMNVLFLDNHVDLCGVPEICDPTFYTGGKTGWDPTDMSKW
jgi:prepilin-type processing-associated H-X9-DG protein